MPGIGVRTAARILREVGDASAFNSSAHLAAYAGIAPVTRSSGSSIKGEHPARTGNRKLKRAFFPASFAALSDPTSRAYYQRKRDEGKKHNAALTCLARRRCDVVFAMLRNKTYYRHPETVPAPSDRVFADRCGPCPRVATRSRDRAYRSTSPPENPPRPARRHWPGAHRRHPLPVEDRKDQRDDRPAHVIRPDHVDRLLGCPVGQLVSFADGWPPVSPIGPTSTTRPGPSRTC
ncbi:Transposase IS116/IS110/IS902 family protein [Actinoalloteichus cyanogriseus DSM 43889]|uniref:Transposase IS116/IS110/IS902 family protein n=1 Tax=Actinoalloteichus caeruleus DSM 43889 TaxID=1120930 RepID=A0ABT1JGR4_ACTCY|nr:Transposase IS116/IS110/IS902 family protein [Actinoalloteichus caeruleus DSM 43889]